MYRNMEKNALFANRVGILATMHQKERVMAPLLEKELGIKVRVTQNFNTDSFGTFTREIKRPRDQLETAKLKAEKALLLTGETLAFASEGAFFHHPALPYIPCNREIVFLLDKTNELELIGQVFSTETNYNHQIISNIEEAYEFGDKVGFPEHGLVVIAEPESEDNSTVVKGITTEQQLRDAVTQALSQSAKGRVQIETDMRALYNPTRMRNIEKATQDLINKIQQTCPNCSLQGFDTVERRKGLYCALCALPTELTLAVIYQCKKCNFSQEFIFPDGLDKADPSQCFYCNP